MGKQEEQKKYVKLRLRLAGDKLRVARLLFRNGDYRDVISRAYYSVFYATKAFLLSRGEDPSSHKGVDVLFHRFCATHQRPKPEFAKMLSLMRQARISADYKEVARLTKRDAQDALEMAHTFLKEIRRII